MNTVIHKIGRRKSAIARVFLSKGEGNITVNGIDFHSYFSREMLRYKVEQPLAMTENSKSFNIKITVSGGGLTGQAEAVRLAISRALCLSNAEDRPKLKSQGLLTRDSRVVERKKYGQKKSRKKFQFSKR